MKLNTTKIGDQLENQVFSIIKDLLKNDDFFVPGKKSKIFQKKPYYSKDREDDIITDISIETYLNGEENYSTLIIIECKNLSSTVPVDDVEEFSSKLRQISAHKGVIISKTGFQKGALKFAQSKKIGLAKVNDGNELKWIKNRRSKIYGKEISAQIENVFCDNGTYDGNFIATNGNILFETIPDLLINLGVIDFFKNRSRYIKTPFLSNEQIQNKIDSLTIENFYHQYRLDIEEMCNFLTNKESVKFNFTEELEDKLMGKIDFKENVIYVNKTLRNDINRFRFTLAHEIGHFVLHSEILEELGGINEKTLLEDEIENTNRLEIQANIFASQILMPIRPLINLATEYFKEERIHRGYLYLDHQACNQSIVFTFLSKIQTIFGVSKEVAKYRLINLNLLKDDSNKSIKNIIRTRKPYG